MEIVDTQVAVQEKVSVKSRLGTGLVLGLGASLVASYLMAGFVFMQEGGFTQQIVSEPLRTTCGTYTDPDGGINRPFAKSAQVDKDCSTEENGDDVCIYGERPGCILAEKTPPTMNVVKNSSGLWTAEAEWYTDVSTNNNFIVMISDTGAIERPWECLYDYSRSDCWPYINTVYSGQNETSHITSRFSLVPNLKGYFMVMSFIPGGSYLRSEVRTFQTMTAATAIVE